MTTDALRSFVLEAELLGFDSIWAGDHVFYRADVLQPLQLLSWVGAPTARLGLGSSASAVFPVRGPRAPPRAPTSSSAVSTRSRRRRPRRAAARDPWVLPSSRVSASMPIEWKL